MTMTQTFLEAVPGCIRIVIGALFPPMERSRYAPDQAQADDASDSEAKFRRSGRDEAFYWGIGTCGYWVGARRIRP
ncbi:hypothetical protein NKH33_16320 [Mesorhizobium sp. M1182]|uniref:hypothetical protein n=2 Tax=unclassified Mesorhizobium TaxID=325217 RepID=UPI0033399FE5